MFGYTLRIKQKNDKADGKSIGVKLGRVCIELGVPVHNVAKTCKVSRTMVYNWFAGISVPRPEKEPMIRELIASLSK